MLPRVSASMRWASGPAIVSGRGVCGGIVAPSGISSCGSRSPGRKNSAWVGLLRRPRPRRPRPSCRLVRRRRRQQRDDEVDVVDVAEGVERELERLAAQQQVALLGRLAAAHGALRAEPVERVEQPVALDEVDVAALRRGLHRDLQRHGQAERVDLERAALDADDLVAVGEPVLAARRGSAICCAAFSPSSAVGLQPDQPSGTPSRARADVDRGADRERRRCARPSSAPSTSPKRERKGVSARDGSAAPRRRLGVGGERVGARRRRGLVLGRAVPQPALLLRRCSSSSRARSRSASAELPGRPAGEGGGIRSRAMRPRPAGRSRAARAARPPAPGRRRRRRAHRRRRARLAT